MIGPKRLTLRQMSETGMLPRAITHQLAFLSECMFYFFDPRRNLEAKTINPEQAEEAERKYFVMYSRLRARMYQAYANYAEGKDRERFLRKARKADEIAGKYSDNPILAGL
ncbi:hypothetical protein FJZ19_03810 [Candidatus Pacearchaeota archaeon]|nr:hypothetical protein [Candidatus Pacearchaeota archaeon]